MLKHIGFPYGLLAQVIWILMFVIGMLSRVIQSLLTGRELATRQGWKLLLHILKVCGEKEVLIL